MAHPLDALKPGYWFRVPNSKMATWCKPNPLPPGLSGYGILTESGTAYDSLRDCVDVFGGGHGDYSGNEIPSFYIETLKWQMTWGPTPNELINGLHEDVNRDTYKDGNPASRHTRDGWEYLPQLDALFAHGGSLWGGSGGNSRLTWLFLKAENRWQRQAQTLADTRYTNVESAYDPISGTMLVHREGRLYRWTPVTNTWQQLMTGTIPDTHRKTAAYDHKRRRFFLFGWSNVFCFDLVAGRAFLTSAGPAIGGAGAEYVEKYDSIYVWEQTARIRTFDTDALTWGEEVPPADSPALPPRPGGGLLGPHGRWRWIPSKNVFIAINTVNDDVYFYRSQKEEVLMPSDVKTVNMTSVPQPGFPEGTVGGMWRVKLIDGPDPRSADIAALTGVVTFSNVAPGMYRGSLQRLGSDGALLGPEVFSAPVQVSADVTVTIDVAAGISLEVIKRTV